MFDTPYKGEEFHFILKRTLEDCRELETRVMQLEKLVHYPVATKKEIDTGLMSNSAQQQATQYSAETHGIAPGNLYAPLRNDTKAVLDLAAFARRLLDPQDLGHTVTFEVRNAARRALGLPEVDMEVKVKARPGSDL